ncbi:MAG: UvrD-helicase domain-containing protein, partial [Clostridiales bacterium]|nr:UvrD-helicase domain-containing protein [Clostridiales bacterium]
MNPTAEQQKAVDARGNVLVSAAAGSGKTTVLVERVMSRLFGDSPTDIDKMLIVTFTEAAAEHMKQSLAKRLAAENSAAALNQLSLLNSANICTIHSFCARMARKYFNSAGCDPSFRVLPPYEQKILVNDTLDELFSDMYEREGNDDFISLSEAFDEKIKDDALRELTLKLYEFSQGASDPVGWISEQKNLQKYQTIYDFENKKWFTFLMDYAERELADALVEAQELLRQQQRYAAYLPQKNEAVLLADIRSIERVLDVKNDFNSFCREIEFAFESFVGGRLPKPKDERISADEAKEIRAAISDRRTKFIREPIKKLQKIFVAGAEQLIKNMNTSGRLTESLCALTLEFAEKYDAAKQLINAADFGDLERMCLKVLADESVRDEISASFEEVFTDEYQDSNNVQEEILTKVSNGKNMFMVGDVKQSIYSFRLAEPEIFINKRETFNNNKETGTVVALSANFRSRANVIDAVNFIFSQIMSAETGGIDYDESAELHQGMTTFPNNANNFDTEIIVALPSTDNESDTPEADDADVADATVVCERILQLFEENFLVADGEENRKLKFSDIAVLLRAGKKHADTFAKILSDAGIRARVADEGGYFETAEIMTAVSYLKIIDNPL